MTLPVIHGLVNGTSAVAEAVRGYQIAVIVTGGASGTLDLESITIDTGHSSFIFNDAVPSSPTYPATDVTGDRLAAALQLGSSAPALDDYLGTFTFRASLDASGTFTVKLRTADTLLRDVNSQEIIWRAGDSAAVSVQGS